MKTSLIIAIYWIIGVFFSYWIYSKHDSSSTDTAIALLCIWAGVFIAGVAIHLIRKKLGSK